MLQAAGNNGGRMTLFFKLPAKQVSGSACAIVRLCGIAKTSTLTPKPAQFGHVGYQFGRALNSLPLKPEPARNGRKSRRPTSFGLRSIEGRKPNVRRKPLCAVDDRSHSNLICRVFVSEPNATAGMNFPVEVKIRKPRSKIARHLNFVPGARPNGFSVPVSPAAVQLFGSKPANKRGLPNPILGQNHLGLVNHKDIKSSFEKM